MSLKERLALANGEAEDPGPDEEPVVERTGDIKRRLHYRLIDELGSELDRLADDDAAMRQRLEQMLSTMLQEERTPLSLIDRDEIRTDVIDNIVGFGPIEALLHDPEVTEIMVNNPETVYVERGGKIYATNQRFIDNAHLLRIIDKIVSRVGRRIDESVPMVDARLPDGSRVNAIIHPLAINGPMLTVRKFAKEPFTARDLIGFGTMTEHIAEFLQACVQGRLNILISGGTGTGKTTTLNVVSEFLPGDERIVTIEDAAELRLRQQHVLRLEARPPNIEGKGQVTIRDLVRNSLRMRPDRIVVGEVRGGEALDMLQAMNTGHEGSLTTIHANSPRDALSRLETMVLMSGLDLPVRAIREQISSALNLLVHQSRLRDGSRRITRIAEVQGMEGDVIVLQDIFAFDFSMGVDPSGRFRGRIKSTGVRPKFAQRLADYGVPLPADMFTYEAPSRR